MVKHNVDLKYSSAYIDSLLPSHKCEPLPEFQEEFADVIDQRFFKITLLIDWQLRKTGKLKDIRIFYDVLRLFYNLAFFRQSQYFFFVLA